MRGASGLLIVPLIAAGCAVVAPDPVYLTPPDYAVPTETFVDGPPREVFENLLRRLPMTGCRIHSTFPAAGVVNLGWETDAPGACADCGVTDRLRSDGTRGPDVIPVTAPWSADTEQIRMVRRTRLLAVVTMGVRPRGSGSVVSVNAQYVFTCATGGEYLVPGQPTTGRPGRWQSLSREVASVNFTSQQPDSADWETDPEAFWYVTCRSTGHLEARLLALARGEEWAP